MKRFISCLASVTLALALVPTSAFGAIATGTTDVLEETSSNPAASLFENTGATASLESTTTPEAAAATFSGGSGTSTQPYLISSVNDLLQLATNVDGGTTYSDKYFQLTNDLDLISYNNWNPIGTNEESKSFQGKFDGANHTIRNLNINNTSNAGPQGLFASVGGTKAEIKNLTVEGNVKNTANTETGGIAGRNRGLIYNCTFKGSVEGTAKVGGIAGSSDKLQIWECSSNATVIGTTAVGGIVGYAAGSIWTCTFSGKVQSSASENSADGGVGGIVGACYAAATTEIVKECVTTSTATVTGQQAVGGIVGNITSGKVYQCKNEGSVVSNLVSTGTQNPVYMGGIVGSARNTTTTSVTTIEQCGNEGDIKWVNAASSTGGQNIGGVVGTTTGKIIDCYNAGWISTVNLAGHDLGGIVGTPQGSVAITRCYNTGAITAVAGSHDTGAISGPYSSYFNCTNCYYYPTTCSTVAGLQTTVSGVTALSNVADYKTASNFTGWDFTENTGVWSIAYAPDPHDTGIKSRPLLQAFGPYTHTHTWGTPTYTWATDHSKVTGTRVCTVDSDHVDTAEATATSVQTNPTCTEAGSIVYTAAFTQEGFTTQTETVPIPALNHNLTHTAAIASTCKDAGHIEYWQCARCSKYFSNAAATTEITFAQTASPLADHTLTAHAATEPTCSTEGNIAYWTCSVCNKYFSDAAATSEIAAASTIRAIVSSAHSWGPWTQTVAPSCTAEGTEQRTCAHNSTHVETRSVAKTSHEEDEGTVTIAPTTQAKGKRTYRCKHCGTVLRTEDIDMLLLTNATKPTVKNYTYDGKTHVGVVTGEGYTLSGTTSASMTGSYRVTATLKSGYQWSDGSTAALSLTWEVNPPAGVRLLRLYSPYTSEHLYTLSEEERDNLVSLGWRDEGLGWVAPSFSATPVYRVYSLWTGDHHYTTSIEERDNLVNLGWRDEGIGWYSADETSGMTNWKEHPLYRMYAPFLVVGQHHYTVHASEADFLAENNWNREGIAWYALSVE